MEKSIDENFICPVLERCIDHPEKCESCNNNAGKRSYYAPEVGGMPYGRKTRVY